MMKRPFDCFVGIDWSGNKEKWQKGLKVAYARPGSSAPRLISGSGPNGKWSRTEAVRWIGELVDKERALIGLDFAFGFPHSEDSLSWEYVEKLCCDDANFYGGKFFRTPDALHSSRVNSPWLPRCDYSAHDLRVTDRAAKKIRGATPQSIFNAYGAAQVGPSSTSGMRALLHLRHRHGDKIAIWPFDDLDDSRSTIVEIFPRFFPLSLELSPKLSDHTILNAALKAFDSAEVKSPPASEDEGDALLSAAALRSLSANPSMFKVASGHVKAEGWIFGVPCNACSSDDELTPKQIAEVHRRLSVDEPFATEDDVKATFDRLGIAPQGTMK